VGDADDVRVDEADQGVDLAGEAVGELGVVEQGGARHLDDHVAVEVGVVRLEDAAHAALAQLGRDVVAPAAQPPPDPGFQPGGHGASRWWVAGPGGGAGSRLGRGLVPERISGPAEGPGANTPESPSNYC